jgi:hypothetical protein
MSGKGAKARSQARQDFLCASPFLRLCEKRFFPNELPAAKQCPRQR